MIIVEGIVTQENIKPLLSQITELNNEYSCIVQVFDARYIAGKSHLKHAIEYSQRSIDNETSIANSHQIEFLLYASGRRQINRAMEMGMSPNTTDIIIAIEGEDAEYVSSVLKLKIELKKVLNPFKNKHIICSFFGIPDTELDMHSTDLESLVIERVVLLSIGK